MSQPTPPALVAPNESNVPKHDTSSVENDTIERQSTDKHTTSSAAENSKSCSSTIDTPTSTGNTTSSTSHDDDHPDVFSNAVPKLFDKLHDALHANIRDKVSSLPFPRDVQQEGSTNSQKATAAAVTVGEQEATLSSILSRSYTKCLDLAEIYATRYLFTISEEEFTSQKKRRKMMERFWKEWVQFQKNGKEDDGTKLIDNDTNGTNDTNDTNDSSTTSKQTENGKESSNDDTTTIIQNLQQKLSTSSTQIIINDDDDNNIQKELKSLRSKLQSTKRRQLQLKSQLSTLHHLLHHQISRTERTIQSQLDNDALHNSVSAAMMGRDGLAELLVNGEEMILALEEEKSSRVNSGDGGDGGHHVEGETLEFSEAMKAAAIRASSRPKKRKTLEEDFEERRKVMAVTGTSISGGPMEKNGDGGDNVGNGHGRLISSLFKRR